MIHTYLLEGKVVDGRRAAQPCAMGLSTLEMLVILGADEVSLPASQAEVGMS